MTSESYAKGNKCSFLSIDCDKNKHWKMVPCDESLYSRIEWYSGILLRTVYENKAEDIF